MGSYFLQLTGGLSREARGPGSLRDRRPRAALGVPRSKIVWVPQGCAPGRVPRVPQPGSPAQNPKVQKIALALLIVKKCLGVLNCQKNALAFLIVNKLP